MGRAVSRAFVTGIGGQDGTYLAERLLADGVEVHGLTRSAQRPAHCPADVVLHHGDVRDTRSIERLLRDLRPTEAYNLAALSSVARSWAEPELTHAVNGAAAVAFMDSALAAVPDVRVVQASSAEIFGNPTRSPQDESTPIAPTNPYGEAKATAHRHAAARRDEGAFVSAAVLYNHESPRRPAQFVTRRITSGVAAIARGEAERLVLGNLAARRDWGWAPDHVDALVRAARAEAPAEFVVATGVAHSVRDFAAAAFAAAGVSDFADLLVEDPEFARPVDAVELVGDPTRAREVLGWSPTVQFAEVVARMVDADLSATA